MNKKDLTISELKLIMDYCLEKLSKLPSLPSTLGIERERAELRDLYDICKNEFEFRLEQIRLGS